MNILILSEQNPFFHPVSECPIIQCPGIPMPLCPGVLFPQFPNAPVIQCPGASNYVFLLYNLSPLKANPLHSGGLGTHLLQLCCDFSNIICHILPILLRRIYQLFFPILSHLFVCLIFYHLFCLLFDQSFCFVFYKLFCLIFHQ